MEPELLQKQTPVSYNADNLLAFAIANDELRGYISRPNCLTSERRLCIPCIP